MLPSPNFQRLSPLLFVMFSVLGGCSQLMPPSIPSGKELADYDRDDFSAYASAHAPRTPKDKAIIGITYVNERCNAFFDSIEQAHRYTNVGKSTLATSSIQVAALMAIAKKSAYNIATVAAAVEITKVLLEQSETEFTFAPHSVELRALIQAAMNAQAADIGNMIKDPGLSEIEVVSLVKKYASNCTLAAVHEAWNRAVAKAVIQGVVPEKTAQAGQPIPPPQAPPAPSGAESNFPRRNSAAEGNVLGLKKYVVR